MDSPKRKAQKNKDYRRHRMMRLLNRRKATAQEAMSEIAERELMRRLRITPLKRFEDGKGVFDYLDEYAEEYEPYAAGLAIGSDAVALGTAATGVGAPIGAAIATAGNIPNLAIDASQAARNWYKYVAGENDNLMTPIMSTGEAVLDAAGVNSALKGISYMKDRAIINEAARIYEREFAAR